MARPCLLPTLPVESIDLLPLIGILGEANRELSRYDGTVRTLHHPDILLAPFITQEAVLSSRIEGTQATLDEVFEEEAGVPLSENKKEDIEEIKNYRKALRYASSSLQTRELSLALVKEIHGILLDGVRGKTKTPGCFRTVQNWIGPNGCSMEEANYIPPEPIHVDTLMENWLEYVAGPTHIDPLVQTAVLHAQFELIHPFLDGNGRIGRLLIPLFLYERRILYRPVLYMSAYLEANRDAYYRLLGNIHRPGAWGEWVAFFLQGIVEQARENGRRAHALHRFYHLLREDFRKTTHSEFAQLVLDCLFEAPTFTKPQIIARMRMKDARCSQPTVRSLLNQLADHGLIELIRKGAGRSPDIFRLNGILQLASGLPFERFDY